MKQHETPFHNDPMEYDIKVDGYGVRQAINPTTVVTVVPTPDAPASLKKLRAIKGVGGPGVTFDTCLVASLDGVNVYVKEGNIIVTKQDLRL